PRVPTRGVGGLSQPGLGESQGQAMAVRPAPVQANGQDRSGRASPAVRRLADEHNLDLSLVKGTGLGGRVTKRDVEEFVAAGGGSPVTIPAPVTAPASPQPDAPEARRPGLSQPGLGGIQGQSIADELIPLTPMRRAIAEHM